MLELKGLDFSSCRQWVLEAYRHLENGDGVFAFIAAWIGFNYYYGTYALEYRDSFRGWLKRVNRGGGDKSQWLYLVSSKEFGEFFEEFRRRQRTLLEELTVVLPIRDMLHGKVVPEGIEGRYRLADLPTISIFEIMYQIRNNLFHGAKSPFKLERDRHLSNMAARFMIMFVSELLLETGGEELDGIFDGDRVMAEIRNLYRIVGRDQGFEEQW